MKRAAAFIALLTLFSLPSFAGDPVFRIRAGDDYNRYSNEELRRRVYDLERAVYQLQQRIYNLEAAPPQPQAVIVAPPPEKPFTCSLEDNFGQMHMATAITKTLAEAETLAKCSRNQNSMFCKRDRMHCGQ